MSEKTLYSDLDSPDMIKKRKEEYHAGLIRLGFIVSIPPFFYIWILIKGGLPINNFIHISLESFAVTCLFWVIFYFSGVHIPKKALIHGVVVNQKRVGVFGKIIPIASIVKAEIIELYPNNQIHCAISYMNAKKEQNSYFLRDVDTDDVTKFCGSIRKLKGWEDQDKIESYDRPLDWKNKDDSDYIGL